jgi:endo-1,4-beta-xylanase
MNGQHIRRALPPLSHEPAGARRYVTGGGTIARCRRDPLDVMDSKQLRRTMPNTLRVLPASLLLLVSSMLVGSGSERPALKDVFRDAFVMGAAVNEAIVSGEDAAAQALVVRHFGSITIENAMKAGPINPEPGVWNFGPADAFVEFGQKHNLFIVGHTLVWHNQTPAWFFHDEAGTPNTPEAQIERMRRHIEAVAGRYKGRVHAWDVVNEVIDDDGSYRPTTWVKGVGSGDELVKAAFRFASEYAPDAELYYNDFNAWRPAKRDGIVRMVKMLQARGSASTASASRGTGA